MGLLQGGPSLPVAKAFLPVCFWCTDRGLPSREGNQRAGTKFGSVHGLASLCCGRQTRTGSCKSSACRNHWDVEAGSVPCRYPKMLYFREGILLIKYANNKHYLCCSWEDLGGSKARSAHGRITDSLKSKSHTVISVLLMLLQQV